MSVVSEPICPLKLISGSNSNCKCSSSCAWNIGNTNKPICVMVDIASNLNKLKDNAK